MMTHVHTYTLVYIGIGEATLCEGRIQPILIQQCTVMPLHQD